MREPEHCGLRHDPAGRLYETIGPVNGTTRFLYDGDALVAEYGGSGTLLRRYIHGAGGGDNPLVWFEGAGISASERRYLFTNHQGSVTAIADGWGRPAIWTAEAGAWARWGLRCGDVVGVR